MPYLIDKIEVSPSSGNYDILIGSNWLQDSASALASKILMDNVLIITNPVVGDLYAESLIKGLRQIGCSHIIRHDIPDGEHSKNINEYNRAQEALALNFPDPASVPVVIALGGGVVGDISGFVAGTFRRGITCIQVPTTLLACVDSSVGGKTGINFANIKNLLGVFHQPQMVVIDLATLHTLEKRQLCSGMAEVVKYGVVCNRQLFEFVEAHTEALLDIDPNAMAKVVGDCCRIKASVVREDERDTGGRRIVLNFGHTLGHAIESASDYRLLHGEAIAIGMLAATDLAIALNLCDKEVKLRIEKLLRKLQLPVEINGRDLQIESIMKTMRHDKKFSSGENKFVLPTKLGTWQTAQGIAESLIHKILSAYL
ncbi:MAG: 3-dehydroquinate synthase [Lentisphaerae bacterium]|nr:3-dehydroquinate synthase [Lentisphaerota bacterium]